MFVALDELFHQVVFLHLALAAESDNLGAVVLLGLVLHLVVHAGFLVFQHALGEGDGVDEFGHGQFGHLLQRVEDVHHPQVLRNANSPITNYQQNRPSTLDGRPTQINMNKANLPSRVSPPPAQVASPFASVHPPQVSESLPASSALPRSHPALCTICPDTPGS